MAMNNITAAQWDAVAWAQGSYGISDKAVAQILNCQSGTVRNARMRGGWEIRDLTKAHSRLSGWRTGEGRHNNRWHGGKDADCETETIGETGFPQTIANVDLEGSHLPEAVTGQVDDEQAEEDTEIPDPATVVESLTTALSKELQKAADGQADAAVLKRIDVLVAASKTFEKLMALKPKAADELFADADALAVEEKTKLLTEMDRRIDDLAQQRAQEIQNGRSGADAE